MNRRKIDFIVNVIIVVELLVLIIVIQVFFINFNNEQKKINEKFDILKEGEENVKPNLIFGDCVEVTPINMNFHHEEYMTHETVKRGKFYAGFKEGDENTVIIYYKYDNEDILWYYCHMQAKYFNDYFEVTPIEWN